VEVKKLISIAAALCAVLASFYFYFRDPLPPADFSVAFVAENRSLDPAISTSMHGLLVIRALFEGLVRFDFRTFEPIPGVAKSWDISKDRRTYTFHLRRTLWSDSTPVVASDFAYAWERLLNPNSTSEYDYMLFYLKNAERYRKRLVKSFDSVGVKAENDSTLTVELENSTPYFLSIAAFESLMPVNRNCVEKHGIQWTRPGNMVSNGAYRLVFHQLNYKLRLEKNATYWDHQRPFFNTIDIFTCEGLNTAFNFYETGDVDMIDDYPNIIAEEIQKRPDKLIAPYFGTYMYRFNVDVTPFNDNRIRRAIEMAIDKQAIVTHVTKGGEVAAGALVPPGLRGYPVLQGVPYNPDSAKALLTEAGYPDGKGFPTIELIYNTSENHKKIAEAVAYMLQNTLGIEIAPRNVEWKVLQEKMRKKDYQMIRGSWIGDYADPNTFIDMFVTDGGNNRTNWSNREYDSLVALAARTADPQKRMGILAEAEKIIIEEGPIINIYYYITKFLIKKGIKGIYPNIRGDYHLADLYRVN
jgi:oligopeptide transport system substrate-binding protein